MFYSQPLATRFGTDLIAHISSGGWTHVDIAVAWVRESGIRHLSLPLTAHLKAGGELRIVVGVDLDNTTAEGLAGLLALKAHGKVSLFVNHNESGTIFHPKLYLIRSTATKKAKLIVGSNNITESGLYRNTEAGLEVDCAIGDPLVAAALTAVDAWCDTSLGLARELTPKMLSDLVASGYVASEASVRAASAARVTAAKKPGGPKLFGSVAVSPPPKPPLAASKTSAVGSAPAAPKAKAKSPATTATPAGQVLLMRVRTARGTQTQIPKEVAEAPFFAGVTSVISVHSGESRGVRPARARGIVNTLKLEIPETRSMADPVMRLEHIGSGVQYEVYDRTNPKGAAIWASLNAGLLTSPVSTHLTKPSNPGSSTWWRFI